MKCNRKWISIGLIAGLLSSSLVSVTSGFANEVIGDIRSTIIPDNSRRMESVAPPPSEELVLHTRSVSEPIAIPLDSNMRSSIADQGNRTEQAVQQRQENDEPPIDKYNITREQADELFRQGFGLDDVLKADELANIWDVDPFQLLEEKKRSAWNAIESRLQAAKYGPLVDKLKLKHPNAAQKLDTSALTLGEQLSLLTIVDQSLVANMDEAVKRYDEKGTQAISDIYRENRFYGKVSASKMEQYGLTEADVQTLRLTDEKLSVMEKADQSKVKERLSLLKTAKQQEKQLQENQRGGGVSAP